MQLKEILSAENPTAVPPYPHGGGDHVPILWVHRDKSGNPDPAASKGAAKKMKDGYAIGRFGAVYPSNHTQGIAIDMTFSWTGQIAVKAKNGKWHVISEGSSKSSQEMNRVAATYGVIHNTAPDYEHWSVTGK